MDPSCLLMAVMKWATLGTIYFRASPELLGPQWVSGSNVQLN